MLVVGRIIDRLGTRLGYALSMVFWSLASMGHALASSFTGFIVARSALGFGESGVFPASIKTVAEWFPKKERALATGIFNAGANLGAIVTPFIVTWITIRWGWRWAFLIAGLGLYMARILAAALSPARGRCSRFQGGTRLHPQRSATSDGQNRMGSPYSAPSDLGVRGGQVHDRPHLVVLSFLDTRFSATQTWIGVMNIRLPIVVIYVLADVGSVAGGWFHPG